MKHLRVIFLVLCIVLLTGLFTSCLNNNKETTLTNSSLLTDYSVEYGGTQSPGDFWEFIIDIVNGVFSAKNYATSMGQEVSKNYSGTVETTTSCYLKFTVTATDDITVPLNSVFYGINIPGNCLLIMPCAMLNKNVIALTVYGNPNYTVGMECNYVPLANSAYDFTTNIGYGNAEITSVSGALMTMSGMVYKFDGTVASGPDTYYSTISGNLIYDYSDPERTNLLDVVTMTPSGCFSYDCGANGGGFGMAAPEVNIDIADALSKQYRGFDTIYAGTMAGTYGAWAGPNISDPTHKMDSGIFLDGSNPDYTFSIKGDVDTVDFTAATQVRPGLFTGITDEYGSQYIFVVNKINNKYMILGIGKLFGDGKADNFFVVQVD